MKHWYRILLILMLALLLGIGGLSLVSWKQASGVNETPVDAPQFSWQDPACIPQNARRCARR